MKVTLKNVLPNPFRQIDVYPIDRAKIEQLKKSISSTDFWENIVARKKGRQVEIAYGHHRLAALRELYPETKAFDFIVRDLGDEEMLKIMAHENLDEWSHDSAIERETVRAIVQAYAEGRVHLKRPTAQGGNIRYAPSFCFGNQVDNGTRAGRARLDKPYDAATIGRFLGETLSQTAIKAALQALCLIEQGHLKESQLKNMSNSRARMVLAEVERGISEAKKIERDAKVAALSAKPAKARALKDQAARKARAVIKVTSQAASAQAAVGGSSREDVSRAARDARAGISGARIREMPDLSIAAERQAKILNVLFCTDGARGKPLAAIVRHKEGLSFLARDTLVKALDTVLEHVQYYRDALAVDDFIDSSVVRPALPDKRRAM